jgi:DNA replication protein DnaC
MRIPEQYWQTHMDRIPDNLEYKKDAQYFIDNVVECMKSGESYYMHGPYGHGKTGLATLFMKVAAAYGYLGTFIIAEDLHAYGLGEHYFSDGVTMMERCKTVSFLVIDELDLVDNQKWVYQKLENLIRSRIADKLPTIITSNHEFRELVTYEIRNRNQANIRPLAGLASVMQEKFTSIEVKGKDFRKDIREERANVRESRNRS